MHTDRGDIQCRDLLFHFSLQSTNQSPFPFPFSYLLDQDDLFLFNLEVEQMSTRCHDHLIDYSFQFPPPSLNCTCFVFTLTLANPIGGRLEGGVHNRGGEIVSDRRIDLGVTLTLYSYPIRWSTVQTCRINPFSIVPQNNVASSVSRPAHNYRILSFNHFYRTFNSCIFQFLSTNLKNMSFMSK